jgi:invasion protein IalB
MTITKMYVALIGLVLSAAVVRAQQQTTALYGDWTLSCIIAPDPASGQSCGLVQLQKLKGQSNAISQIGIGRDAKSDPLKISIEVISNAWITGGVELMTNENALVLTAPFKWCTSTRCLADAELSDVNIQTLNIQTEPGKLAYKTASRVSVSIPVSFDGFGKAMDALQNKQ